MAPPEMVVIDGDQDGLLDFVLPHEAAPNEKASGKVISLLSFFHLITCRTWLAMTCLGGQHVIPTNEEIMVQIDAAEDALGNPLLALRLVRVCLHTSMACSLVATLGLIRLAWHFKLRPWRSTSTFFRFSRSGLVSWSRPCTWRRPSLPMPFWRWGRGGSLTEGRGGLATC